MPPALVWLALAQRAVAAERFEEALRCFEAAIAHEPRHALAHLGRAVVYAQLGRERESQEAMDVVLDAARSQPAVLYELARLCVRQGQAALAASLLHDAVAAMPALEERAVADALFADHPTYLMAIGRL